MLYIEQDGDDQKVSYIGIVLYFYNIQDYIPLVYQLYCFLLSKRSLLMNSQTFLKGKN